MPSREPVDSSLSRSPLSCSEVQLWMSIEIDGEDVPPETRGRVDEHLSGCQPCERWLEEETERSSRLRAHLQPDPAAQRVFEETLLEAARDAGWDGRRLRHRRGRHLFGPGRERWRNSLILIAAAALFLAVPAVARLFQPEVEVSSSPTRGDLAPSLLTPFLEGHDHRRVVPDAEGRPVEVRFTRSLYRYRVLPVENQIGAGGDVDGDLDGDLDGGVKVERSELELELERVESRPVRLTSWPYQ